MVEEFALLRDFALIMIVAGVVVFLFRRLHQPPILGYLLAGLLIGPYSLPSPPITDVHTISLLADIGLVLLLFGVGMEFNWSTVRHMGATAVIIALAEIFAMISLGFGLGRLLGWSSMDSLFLGGAMQVTSTALVVQILKDFGKQDILSSRLIIAISVVEDFAAVVIITVLSGIATTGVTDMGDIGSLSLRMFIFVLAALVFGMILVPRIIRFTHRFHYQDVFLLTSLGLCFAMALLGRYLGLSVAAGAFLMGILVGNTEQSKEVKGLLTPIRDMFAALYFVTMGMLINITQFTDFIVPAIVVAAVFILGKILSNSIATLVCGYNARTSLQVGMGMPVMGEFSLAIAKVGLRRGVIEAPIYPIIATSTAITSLITPYLIRSADSIADFISRISPAWLKEYISSLTGWTQTLRSPLSRDNDAAIRTRGYIRGLIVNHLIVMVIVGMGTFGLSFSGDLSQAAHIRVWAIGLSIGFLVLLLCIPSLVLIWRNLQALADEATAYLLRRRLSAANWGHEALRIVIRDSVLIVTTVFAAMWFIPFIVNLFFIGSFALAVPLLLLAFALYLVLRSVRHIHGLMEKSLEKVLIGDEPESARFVTPTGTRQNMVTLLVHFAKQPIVKTRQFLRARRHSKNP